MLLVDLPTTETKSLPSISILNTESIKNDFYYPDSKVYYIISEAGKVNPFIGAKTVLLNNKQSYPIQNFSINSNAILVLDAAKSLFSNSKPIDGDALEALLYCLNNSGRKTTNKKNRL